VIVGEVAVLVMEASMVDGGVGGGVGEKAGVGVGRGALPQTYLTTSLGVRSDDLNRPQNDSTEGSFFQG